MIATCLTLSCGLAAFASPAGGQTPDRPGNPTLLGWRCIPIRVELPDTLRDAAYLGRAVEQAVLSAWAPTVRDRDVRARVAFVIRTGSGLARLEDARVVTGSDPGGRLRGAFQTSVPLPAGRFGERSAAVDAVGVVRGDCLVELRGAPQIEPDVGVSEPGPAPAYFEFQVERPARPYESNPSPRHPEVLRSANVTGQVLVQFVVDTAGHADPRTFKVLRSSHDLFTQAVRAVVPQMRFYPAEVGGRRVRQLVQMPFQFDGK